MTWFNLKTSRGRAIARVGILALVAVAGVAYATAQVVVPPPVVPRPPSNTDRLSRQPGDLNRFLDNQQQTRQKNLQGLQAQEKLRQRKERDRRWIAPVTPYDRPIGAPSTPPPSN